jgi:two-component sensor histidine kinase
VYELETRLGDTRRIRVIDDILAHHANEGWEFDRITRLAGAILDAPMCLVSLVTSDRQVFAGACGLPEELDSVRETPISHSICKHAVLTRNMLVIEDTTLDAMVCDIPYVKEYAIRAYLGCPLMSHDGHVLGSFCAIDYSPREWSRNQIDQIRDFAALVVEKIEGRMIREKNRSAFDVVIHDLKSPLSGILMASALLEEQASKFPESLKPLLAAVCEEGAKALRLVESLARDNHNETVDICDDPQAVLLTLVERMRVTADAKSIGLHVDLTHCAAIMVGAWVIEQVTENLLSNAFKYSPAGSTVRISTSTAGKVMHLSIMDEGPGFTEDDRKMIFRRYTRLSAEPTGNEPSTGLGLSIVKRLVDQHGGRIELMQNPGRGAEFRITFPIVPDDA